MSTQANNPGGLPADRPGGAMLPEVGVEGLVGDPGPVSVAGGVGVVAGGPDEGTGGLPEGGEEAAGELTVGVEGLDVEGLGVAVVGVGVPENGGDRVEPVGDVTVGDFANLGVD